MHLPRVSLFAFVLAAAGVPLYIHLPRFAAVELEMSLATLGVILLAIRAVDLVQDPAIGWAIDRWPRAQWIFGTAALLGLSIGFPLLFSLEAGPQVALWLTLTLVLLFSAYSLGMILLYGRTATLAPGSALPDTMRLAAFRETGMLAGVIFAAVAPLAFAALGGDGYLLFGLSLCAIGVLAALLTAPLWQRIPLPAEGFSIARYRDQAIGRLLLLALVNGLPVAVTSTLFVFFVEDRLQLQGQAGLLLLVFFAAALVCVPGWTVLARHMSPRKVLLLAMPLAIAGFIGAAFLPAGSSFGMAAICAASGAALGAEMVILPVMFSGALNKAGLKASEGFGLWSFAGKLGLALTSFALLPLLQGAGFTPGQPNSDQALWALTLCYAVLPCVLKLVAVALVWRLPE